MTGFSLPEIKLYPSCDLQEVLKKAVPIDEFFSG